MKLIAEYVNKSEYNWTQMEYLRKLRSDNIINSELFINKNNISMIEQEKWYNNIYVNNNMDIYLVRNKDFGYIGYVSLDYDAVIHKRIQAYYVIQPDSRYLVNIDKMIIKFIENKCLSDVSNINKIYFLVLLKYKLRILIGNGYSKEAILKKHIFKNELMDIYVVSKFLNSINL